MKPKSRFFQRTLSWFLFLGILAALCLVYMGYEKAEKAIDKNPVANLYPTYVGNAEIPLDFNTSVFNEVLSELLEQNTELNQFASLFTDHTLAEVITERLYLPTDDTVSTAIGQRFTVHRLENAYTQEELLLICYGLFGYDLTKGEIPDFSISSSGEKKSSTAFSELSADTQDFLADIIAFLKQQKLISPGAEQR